MLYPGDTNFVLDGEPRKIRVKKRPDIAFVSKQNLKKSKGYYYGALDLAVEIISPTERPGEIRSKLHAYLTYGVKQVWQVYPDTQEIIVYFPDNTSKYRSGDKLHVGELLPGFVLDVKSIFDI